MSTPADPTRHDEPPASTESESLKVDDQLQPGAGRPLVEGPPASVGEPISDRKINVAGGILGLIVLGVAGVLTLIVLVILVTAIAGHTR